MLIFRKTKDAGTPANRRTAGDKITVGIAIIAFLALVGLIFYQVRPIQTVDIKVPVATDRSSYYPGEQVSGIFFGNVYYTGKVEVLREVYCKDFKATIKTDQGDDIFKGISRPTVLDGASRQIGKLPANIPVGSNCVIQFANTYRISTPFGEREITKVYYTQNFAIISVGRRLQLDCEAKGGKDCDKLNSSNSTVDAQGNPVVVPSETADAPLYQPAQSQDSSTGQDSSNQSQTQTNGSTTPTNSAANSTTPMANSAPVQAPAQAQDCSVKVLGVCIKL